MIFYGHNIARKPSRCLQINYMYFILEYVYAFVYCGVKYTTSNYFELFRGQNGVLIHSLLRQSSFATSIYRYSFDKNIYQLNNFHCLTVTTLLLLSSFSCWLGRASQTHHILVICQASFQHLAVAHWSSHLDRPLKLTDMLAFSLAAVDFPSTGL